MIYCLPVSTILTPSTPWYDDDGNFAGMVRQERNLTYVLSIMLDISSHPRLYEVEEGSEGQKRSSFCHLACGLGKYLFIKVE